MNTTKLTKNTSILPLFGIIFLLLLYVMTFYIMGSGNDILKGSFTFFGIEFNKLTAYYMFLTLCTVAIPLSLLSVESSEINEDIENNNIISTLHHNETDVSTKNKIKEVNMTVSNKFNCEKCGSVLESNAKFCTTCGEKVSENIKTEMKDNQPSSKVKTWILKAVALFIAAFIFGITRVFFTAISGGSMDGKSEGGGILLFIGMYILLKGLFLNDSSAKKTGGWILVIYIVLSIVFAYYMNNSIMD